ncbi:MULTISPECIES: SpaA isopeptide-forming pilin-related protein [Bhargavaea]|uniref:SpaA isopeptide-forming pilin-related protein n=1 Tax=Bhargavaea changchunensis TaxID=2134037 RepID=A0ABW2NH03_9BACL|nr:SpaA isopeptide-forming pilin-related protein [Bhargavaea sp. CC-171006]
MKKEKRKSLRLWSALLLFMALLIPQMAFAYTVSGDPQNPSLTIHKFEQEPGADAGDEGDGSPGQNAEGKAVSGVEYTLKMTHRYNAEKDAWVEESGPEIKGTTGADGTVTFTKADGLELGRYEVDETKGPEHIILNPESFAVDIPMTNKEGTALNYDVHIYPKNETIRKNVELRKVDENGEALEGVTFKLYNKDGSPAVDNENHAVPELTTNNDGVINVSGLAAGKYYFQETAVPYGYALNTTKIGFTIQKTGDKGQDIEVVWDNVKRFAENGTVTNYFIPTVDKDAEGEKQFDIDRDKVYSYNITIDTPKNIDQYDALIVTDELDGRLAYEGNWSVTGAPEGSFTFKQDGQKLEWKADPSQLTGGGEIVITFDAKIKPDAMLTPGETGIPNTVTLDFDNSFGWRTINDPTAPPEDPETPPVVTPTQGGIQVIKVDASDNTVVLSGAEFKLTSDEAGKNIIDTSAMGDVVEVNNTVYNGLLENLTTDNDGKFEISGLTPGTYYLHETKAPTYTDDEGKLKSYRLLTKPIEVVVENSQDYRSYEVENSKSDWILPTTGGLGTTLFSAIGLLLMMSATVLYMRRRKADTNEA